MKNDNRTDNRTDHRTESSEQNRASKPDPLTFREMLSSTLWAAIGVQKSRNRRRDFSRGHWLHFVYMGIGFTTVLALSILAIVHIILA